MIFFSIFFSFLSQRSVCSFVRSSGAHHPRHIVNPMQVLSFSVVFPLATKESEYKTRRVVVAGSRVECQDKHNCARKNKPKANRRGQRESDDRRGAPLTQTRARRALPSGRRCPPHARMEASPPPFSCHSSCRQTVYNTKRSASPRALQIVTKEKKGDSSHPHVLS